VLRIQHCPLRLRSLIPPPNYGATKSGAVFRSAYPQDRNIEFLKGLDVQTVLYVTVLHARITLLLTCAQLLGSHRAFRYLQPMDPA